MNKYELMNCLHQYTPWEMLHMQNMDYIQSIEGLNQSLEHPLTQEDKAYGLHLPTDPALPYGTLTEEFFFSEGDICIIQHDRFTPARTHNHEFYELQYVYEGEFTQEIEGKSFLMHTGDFSIIPPYIYHALDVHNYSIVLNILITRSKFEDMLIHNLQGSNVLSGDFMKNVYADSANNYIIFHTNGDPAVQDLILHMCLEQLNQENLHQYFLDSYLHLLVGQLLRNYTETCDMPATTTKRYSQNFAILRYINLNYTDITLSGLSEHFHYSPQHMSKLVRAITGTSLSQYVLQKRMEAAADLLASSALKIKDIGTAAGYQNQENFVRAFRKYYGMTPTDYRAKNRKLPDE